MILRNSICHMCRQNFLPVISARKTGKREISLDFQGRPQFRRQTDREKFQWMKDNFPKVFQKIDTSVRETIKGVDMLPVFHGEYNYFWKFDGEQKLEDWVVTSDSDNKQGFSRGFLTLSRNKRALFYGNLCTEVPKDGELTRAGYIQLRSPVNPGVRQTYNWSDFTHLVIRMRGDGRTFALGLQKNYKKTHALDMSMGLTANDQYHYPLFTRGGPYWQIAKIPFSKFYLSHKGTVQDKQAPINTSEIAFLCFNLMDNVDGPFHLEIDYIALLKDTNHQEKHAYELYDVQDHVVNAY